MGLPLRLPGWLIASGQDAYESVPGGGEGVVGRLGYPMTRLCVEGSPLVVRQ